ncbi:MAG: hypothetical protein HYZ53_19480 [Planctomycetes bacterium]|nr:hypothetical protein [Planctomycetota bacterium]
MFRLALALLHALLMLVATTAAYARPFDVHFLSNEGVESSGGVRAPVGADHRHDAEERPGHAPHREPDGCTHHCDQCCSGPAAFLAANLDRPRLVRTLLRRSRPSSCHIPRSNPERTVFHPPIPRA